jgi:hypothetical protein
LTDLYVIELRNAVRRNVLLKGRRGEHLESGEEESGLELKIVSRFSTSRAK